MRVVIVVAFGVGAALAVLTLVGTALLRVAMARRFARYSAVPSMIALERGPAAVARRLLEAARSPQLWGAGLVHALGLLVGHDTAASVEEESIRRAAELTDRITARESAAGLAAAERERRARCQGGRDGASLSREHEPSSEEDER